MTPERAAEIIVNGVLDDKARVLVGLDAHAHAPLREAARLALPGRRRAAVDPRRCMPAQRADPSNSDGSRRAGRTVAVTPDAR